MSESWFAGDVGRTACDVEQWREEAMTMKNKLLKANTVQIFKTKGVTSFKTV
jgi:hypothetical protein